MSRRLLASALLIAALAVAVQPAHAQGQGNGPPAHSNAGGNSGNSGNNGVGRGSSFANTNDFGPGQKGRGRGDEDVALDAVQSNSAVPLQVVLDKLRETTRDRVIDAELFPRNGILVYQVKVMSADGYVRVFRYDAASGQQIRLD